MQTLRLAEKRHQAAGSCRFPERSEKTWFEEGWQIEKPKRKAGMLWARSYSEEKSKSPEPRYSFGTSTSAFAKKKLNENADQMLYSDEGLASIR